MEIAQKLVGNQACPKLIGEDRRIKGYNEGRLKPVGIEGGLKLIGNEGRHEGRLELRGNEGCLKLVGRWRSPETHRQMEIA